MAKTDKAASKTPSKAPPSKAKAKAAATRAPVKAKKVERATRPSPLALVKDKFGGKQALVDAVVALASEDLWLARTSTEREGADSGKAGGLKLVSNAKLLRLHSVLSTVKEKFGSRDKLIGAILDLEKRTKDAGYKARLAGYPVPRLYDHYKAAAKRAKAS